jgi:uncharacterized protein YceH (UPF0502 family)
MLPELTANEARLIGCLMEKSVVTPEQYPLTLNALTNACNQKSARDPVMSLDPGAVQRAARDLATKHLVAIKENFKSGVEKYQQRLCNTTYSDLQFSPAEFAIVCLLLLRGPQTAGELRARSGRLHSFQDNGDVVTALGGLINRDGAPLVVKLPRTPGRKSAEYTHLLCGPINIERLEIRAAATPAVVRQSATGGSKALEERISALEAEVAELKAQLRALSDA